MKRFLLSALLVLSVQSVHAQLDDGIYVIPEFDSYAVVLSNRVIVHGYLVLFESDGIAVIVSFEMGNTTADRIWIGAYTASISEDLAIFNIEAVVESDDSDGEVMLSFDAQISDRGNPQAEFRNFMCEVTENDTQGETCERIKSTYFSKLI